MTRVRFAIPFLIFCLLLSGIGGTLHFEDATAENNDINYWGMPEYSEEDLGYFIWATNQGDGWRFIFAGDGQIDYNATGTIEVDGGITQFEPINLHENDTFEQPSDHELEFSMRSRDIEKGISLYFTGDNITFDISINGVQQPENVFIGQDGENPDSVPFTLHVEHQLFLQKIQGDQQQGAPNMTLDNMLAVAFRDESKTPVPNQLVQFLVTSPSGAKEEGKVSDQRVYTNENGVAFTKFTYGDRVGIYKVTAKLEYNDTFYSQDFMLTAIDEVPTEIHTVYGNEQYRGVFSTFPEALGFRVTGKFGNNLRGIKIVAELNNPDAGRLSLGTNQGGESVFLYSDVNGMGEVFFTAGQFQGQYTVHVFCEIDPEVKTDFIVNVGPDLDQDGLPDDVDEDRDGDGTSNDEDQFPEDPEEWTDFDGDGLGDNADEDNDNDGLTDIEEEQKYHSDPHRHSFYEGEPMPYETETRPLVPTSIEEDIEVIAHIVMNHFPEPGEIGNNFTVTLRWRTLTHGYRDQEMTFINPVKNQNKDDGDIEIPDPEVIEPLFGLGYVEDYSLVGYHLVFITGIGQFSTGEEITYYIVVTYGDGSQLEFYPADGKEETVKVQPGIEVVNELTQEAIFGLIFALIGGFIASRRMKNRLAKVSYTDIQWWDAVNKRAFVKVIKIFTHVNDVKELLKRNTGRLIRFLYFTGVAGLLMLAFELFYDPEIISQYSLYVMGVFLIFTVISPVLYVYFSRWKFKNPTVGKIRILFFFLFPILIIAAMGSGNYILGYVLIFMFFYSIPMLLYGNLMGCNWNFLVFNSYKEFRTGFDHLALSHSGPIKRIYAFFFFFAILLMPIFAINSLIALRHGNYDKGGYLGEVSEQMIKYFGYDIYAQIFSQFIAVFIILNVLLLGVVMVFRVIQLQFYASQKFSGKLGFGFKLHFKLRDNPEEQRNLIGFAFFAFFGYSVLLLLLAIYSQIAYLLPAVPYLSEDLLKEFLFYQSVLANVIFVFFWLVSLPKITKMFRLKKHEDGFVIPK